MNLEKRNSINILKSYGIDLEKSTYKINKENLKLGRAGKEYGGEHNNESENNDNKKSQFNKEQSNALIKYAGNKKENIKSVKYWMDPKNGMSANIETSPYDDHQVQRFIVRNKEGIVDHVNSKPPKYLLEAFKK